MVQNRNRRYKKKKTVKAVNSSSPKSNYSRRQKAYSKLELIRPMSLKPKSVIRKFCYFNKAEVINNLDTSATNPYQTQFTRINLNSPWLFNSEQFARANPSTNSMPNCTWNWNKDVVPRTRDEAGPNKQGTSLPGCFNPAGSTSATNPSIYVGDQYRNAIVVGAKWTFKFTPMGSTTNASFDPTAAFACIETEASQLTSQTTIDQLYEMPYTQIRKLVAGDNLGGKRNGAVQPAQIIVKYSPKRMNNIKDLRDNAQFNNHLSTVESTPQANLCAERDSLCVGIVPVLTNKSSKHSLVSHYIECKAEYTVLFTEPDNDGNFSMGHSAGSVFISQQEAADSGYK